MLENKGYTPSLGKPVSRLPPHLLGDQSKLGYPAALDYRNNGHVTDVRDQGYCGSCWAFSMTAVYESLLAMETNQHYDLSEQFVLDCTSGSDCDGGYPDDALDMLTQNGIPL